MRLNFPVFEFTDAPWVPEKRKYPEFSIRNSEEEHTHHRQFPLPPFAGTGRADPFLSGNFWFSVCFIKPSGVPVETGCL
jgi:hypothetical protein